TFRQCILTMAVQASWSPRRQRSMSSSMFGGADDDAAGWSVDMRGIPAAESRIIAKGLRRGRASRLTRQSRMGDPVAGFTRQQGVLVCDGVSLPMIAAAVGTPVHVYSASLLAERY